MDLVGPLNSGLVESCLDTAANQDSRVIISGTVMAVYVDPNTTCLSSPTITVTTKGAPVQTILAVATDVAKWYYPRNIAHLHTTGAPIASTYSLGIAIHDYVNVEISDANYGDNVDVWLLVD
jgi:hypothetical protein